VFISVSIVKDTSGVKPYRIINVQDITERKNAEKVEIDVEKSSVLKLLSAGVAHDLNNLFSILSASTELLHQQCTNKELTAEKLTHTISTM
jgi:hypothetical protein